MLRLAYAAQATGGMGRRAAARLASLQQLRPLQATAANQQASFIVYIASGLQQLQPSWCRRRLPPLPAACRHHRCLPPHMPCSVACTPMLQAPEQAAPKPQYELVVSLADFDLSKVQWGLEQLLWWLWHQTERLALPWEVCCK